MRVRFAVKICAVAVLPAVGALAALGLMLLLTP